MAFSMAGGGPSRPEMNVTLLIDNRFRHSPITIRTECPPPDRTIVIQVVWSALKQDLILKINQNEVSWKDLEPRLQKIFSSRVERIAFVRGDADVDFRYVADVIDTARQAGAQPVGLLAKQ